MRLAVCGLALLLGTVYAAGDAQTTNSVGTATQRPAAPASAAVVVPSSEAPQFEVATIKPSDPANCCARTYNLEGRTLTTSNTYLQWLIKWAYALQDKQIVGGPSWIAVDRYDIAGQSAGTQPWTAQQGKLAMQQLLADRFQLKFHQETREMSAYVLTAARGGAKLTRSDPQKDTVPQIGFHGAVGETMNGFGRDVTLQEFMGEIQRLALDRPIVDRTGISGTYNFDFEFTREDQAALGMATLPDNAAPNLLTALDQQLGLKLQAQKAPVDVLVIDHAEPPSAN